MIERPELRARGTQLLFSAHQVLADALRAGVPGLDAFGAAAAAGASVGALVAVVLHALEHGGSVEEVRAALTATLDRLERGLAETAAARGGDGRSADGDATRGGLRPAALPPRGDPGR